MYKELRQKWMQTVLADVYISIQLGQERADIEPPVIDNELQWDWFDYLKEELNSGKKKYEVMMNSKYDFYIKLK